MFLGDTDQEPTNLCQLTCTIFCCTFLTRHTSVYAPFLLDAPDIGGVVVTAGPLLNRRFAQDKPVDIGGSSVFDSGPRR